MKIAKYFLYDHKIRLAEAKIYFKLNKQKVVDFTKAGKPFYLSEK